jgi:predicted RNA methylase
MRNVGRIKLGYYPLPTTEGTRLRNLLQYPAEATSVLDPCVGTGAALMQLTEGASATLYGVELDADRASTATAAGIETVHGNLFDTQARVESFSILYLNPPYDSEVGSMDNKPMEYLFLEHSYRWLVSGGVLLMMVPHKQLDGCASLLAANFTSFRIFRLTDPEADRFDQVAFVGIRKKMTGEAYQRNRELLVKAIWANPLPTLTGDETPCTVLATPPTVLTYRGLPLDQLEDLAVRSSSWKKVEAFLLPKEERQEAGPSLRCMAAMSDFSVLPVC